MKALVKMFESALGFHRTLRNRLPAWKCSSAKAVGCCRCTTWHQRCKQWENPEEIEWDPWRTWGKTLPKEKDLSPGPVLRTRRIHKNYDICRRLSSWVSRVSFKSSLWALKEWALCISHNHNWTKVWHTVWHWWQNESVNVCKLFWGNRKYFPSITWALGTRK